MIGEYLQRVPGWPRIERPIQEISAVRDGAERPLSSWKLLGLLSAYKVLYAGLIFLAIILAPRMDKEGYEANLHWPREGSVNWGTYVSTWDGAHYLLLSEVGFIKGSPSCAFYPLWPMLIHGTAVILGTGHLWAGLLLSNGLSLAAFFLFYRLVESAHGRKIAALALALLLSSPGALFFAFIYTESLFYLLIVGFFFALFRGGIFWIALTGFFLPLTKAVGIFCAIPLLWHFYSTGRSRSYWLLVLAPVSGYLAYFGLMNYLVGNPFEGFQAQQFFPNSPSIANLLRWGTAVQAFFNVGSFHRQLDSFVDRLFFVIFLASLYPMLRLRVSYLVYTLPAGIVPALSMWFFSFTRHFMVAFPVFIVGAVWLARKAPWWRWGVIGAAAGLQAYFLWRHIHFLWVA